MPIEIESPEQIGYGKIRCNLAESSVRDTVFGDLRIDLKDLAIAYGDHMGKPELREMVAAEGKGLKATDVMLTAGAASALFIVATSLLTKKDRIAVVKPNYATNLETPYAIGCGIDTIDLRFENGFRLDIKEVEKKIKATTRILSITYPHNPTGTMITRKELEKFVELAEKKKIFLLVDETYRELSFENKLPVTASLSDRVISVSSVSKAYGLPGLRLGWLITKNKKLQETFLAAKEQIFLCNSVLDEETAYLFLKKKEQFVPAIRAAIKENFGILKKWMENSKTMEWVEPSGGVVCFPRVKPELKMNMKKFYKSLNSTHGTFVGPGHWFGMPDNYMRIGYGWPSKSELVEGLKSIERVLNNEQ